MRRVYKTPQEVGDISCVLDFCIMLALSNAAYEDFDIKSRDFVEQSLTYIDNHYQGFKTLTKEVKTITGET